MTTTTVQTAISPAPDHPAEPVQSLCSPGAVMVDAIIRTLPEVGFDRITANGIELVAATSGPPSHI